MPPKINPSTVGKSPSCLIFFIVAAAVISIFLFLPFELDQLKRDYFVAPALPPAAPHTPAPATPVPESQLKPFQWNLEGYGHTQRLVNPKPPPRIVWVIWIGGLGTMSPARRRALETIRRNIGVPVRLITTLEQIRELSKPESPVHPLIFHEPQVMSSIHISDYLRGYIMKHYGGGYIDVKPMYHSWADWFNKFDQDPDLWFAAPRIMGWWHTGCNESTLARMGIKPAVEASCNKIRDNWHHIGSDACYIARPGTPLAVEFHKLVNDTLNTKWQAILKHPVPWKLKDRCCTIFATVHRSVWLPEWGPFENPHYPLRWVELHGEVLDPLQLKWNKHVKIGLPEYAHEPYQ